MDSTAQSVAESDQNVLPQLRHRPRHTPALIQFQAQIRLDCLKRCKSATRSVATTATPTKAGASADAHPRCKSKAQIQGDSNASPSASPKRPQTKASRRAAKECGHNSNTNPLRTSPRAISKLGSNAQGVAESGQNVRPQRRHRPRRHRPRHKPVLMQNQAQIQSGLECPKRHRERQKKHGHNCDADHRVGKRRCKSKAQSKVDSNAPNVTKSDQDVRSQL
jgi:hypothetical protein